jgi:hypothetical protein
MKHLVLVILGWITIINPITSQTTAQALLVSLNGSGFLIRNNKQSDLKQPSLFIPDDVVKINEGTAKLLLADGSEITIQRGQTYQIPKLSGKNTLALEEFSESKTKEQSYILRGEEHLAFPAKSNLTNSNKLQLNWKQIDSTSIVTFTIYKSETEEIQWQKKNISDASVSVNKSLPTGNYYWTLEGASQSFTEIGEITISELKSCSKPNSQNTSKDLLETISCYLQNEYYFEAVELLREGIKQYGANSIFSWIMSDHTKPKQ